MYSAVLEVGTNLNTLLLPIIAALVLYFQNKSNKEFKNNGGSTMRDAIDRIEENQKITHDRLDAIEAQVKND